MMINGSTILATTTKCYSKIADIIRAEKRWQTKNVEKTDTLALSEEALEKLASEKEAVTEQITEPEIAQTLEDEETILAEEA